MTGEDTTSPLGKLLLHPLLIRRIEDAPASWQMCAAYRSDDGSVYAGQSYDGGCLEEVWRTHLSHPATSLHHTLWQRTAHHHLTRTIGSLRLQSGTHENGLLAIVYVQTRADGEQLPRHYHAKRRSPFRRGLLDQDIFLLNNLAKLTDVSPRVVRIEHLKREHRAHVLAATPYRTMSRGELTAHTLLERSFAHDYCQTARPRGYAKEFGELDLFEGTYLSDRDLSVWYAATPTL